MVEVILGQLMLQYALWNIISTTIRLFSIMLHLQMFKIMFEEEKKLWNSDSVIQALTVKVMSNIMALPVVEFLREGYKIRKVFA